MTLKEKIFALRKNNKSYNEISKELNCAMTTVAYHCNRNGLNKPINNQKQPKKITDEKINKIKEYYKNHSLIETAKKFDVSYSSVTKYSDNKRIYDADIITPKHIKFRKKRKQNKEKYIEYKGGKCIKCGYDKCIDVLEFHHRNPNEKEFNISKSFSLDWDLIKKELDKCDLVCANCHREIHSKIIN